MTDFQRSIVRFMYAALVVVGAILAVIAWRGLGGEKAGAMASMWPGRDPHRQGVSASGTCIVRTRPDLAEVRITVKQSSTRATDADAYVKSRAAEIIKMLRKGGVEEKDIRTENYRLTSNWKIKPAVMAWGAEETLNVRIRDLDKVPSLLQGAVEAGASSIGSLKYTVSNLNELRAKGREKASSIAREKASRLASSLGGRLGSLISCSETYPGEYDPYGYGMYRGLNYAQANIAVDTPSPDSVSYEELTIQPGELAITVAVNACYELD